MSAATSDKVKKLGANTVTTLSAPGKALAATSITVGSTTNYPTDTGIIIAIREVDSSGALVAGTYREYSATVSSATTLAIVATPVLGTDRVFTAGSTTQVYMPLSSNGENEFRDAYLTQHTQTGAHGAITAPSAVIAGNITANSITIAGSASAVGWNPLGIAQSGTIVNNGNRSYDVPFATTVAGILTPGMRVRIPRTVAAPTQCTSLNGTTQYYNDTTVAGMTFTDDFTASAWVKLSSYPTVDTGLTSRFNGTSGWIMFVAPSGQISLAGYNGAAGNSSRVSSFQSIPLNKWVHITAQLDMSAFTATTTTSYVMIDGVDVPASVARTGTNPTALIQAGNLEIGSFNASAFFPGKLAQVAVFSAKVTQATARTYYSQGLIGTETNLISAYSFNNSINDLNTTNANNLTAQGSAVATNADSPFALDANGVPGGTNEFGIVTKVVTTTATIQVPEGCAIPTSGGVGSIDYSTVATPFGFPRNSGRWQIESLINSQQSNLSATTVIFNVGSWQLSIPIGDYKVGYEAHLQINPSSGNNGGFSASLSTVNNTFSDTTMTSVFNNSTGSAVASNAVTMGRTRSLSLAVATTHFLNMRNDLAVNGTVFVRGDQSVCRLYAEPAYL